MVRKIKGWKAMFAALLLFLTGAILIVCTLPVFTHTRQELLQVPRSEIVFDSAFGIHQLEDKTVEFNISIGQSLKIYATSNGNMSFLIANFTDADGAIQPDQPDLVYFSQNETKTVNTTWSPQSRVPYPGKYYLVFTARDASPDSLVIVHANATKTWTDIQLKEVVAEDRISLLDQNFGYLGSALVILGIAAIRIAVIRNRRSK